MSAPKKSNKAEPHKEDSSDPSDTDKKKVESSVVAAQAMKPWQMASLHQSRNQNFGKRQHIPSTPRRSSAQRPKK